MATAGDRTLAQTSSPYEGGGVGGKFDKRFSRRSRATPYDRPPTTLRNPSWVTKLLVDPAKKLIASGANAVFSSVFRKSLPPLPAPPESNPESSDRIQAPDVHDEGPLAGADCRNPNSEKSGMLELEQLLKQKAFTRSEIDRLTDLLRSKAVDLPGEKDVKSPGTSLSRPVTDIQKYQEYRKSPLAEKGLEVERSQSLVLTPGINSRVLDEDIASPAELAKAYMDRLPSKVSPSTLTLRSQSTRKEGALLSNTPFTPTSSVLTLGTKTAGHFELGKNSFTTPSSRGRSAIFSMARTPYSRAYPTTSGKAGGPSGYLSPSPNTSLQDGKLGSTKLAQKRGSSVLDDFGSVGPMRRIRQKHGLVPQKVAISPRGVDFSKEAQKPLSMLHKDSFMGDWNDARSKNLGDKAANSSSTSSHVPPRCSEVAARILQQLENISPKEKSAESKLNASGEKSPSKLTTNTEMLRRPASNNENAGSLKMLWNIQDHKKPDTSSNRGLPGVQEGTSGIQESGDQNGPQKLYFGGEMMNGDAPVSVKRVLTGAETFDSASISVAQSSKRASMIHAHEGSLGLDVGTYNNGPTSEGRGKFQTSAASQHLGSAKSTKDNSPGVAGLRKASPEPVFGKTSDLRIFGEGTAAFSALPVSTTTSETVKLFPSVSVSEKPKEIEQSSSLALAAEATKARFSMQPKPLSSFSSAGGTGLSQEDAKAKETFKALHTGNFSSSVSNSTPSFSIFGNSNLKNGSGSMSPSSLSSPPLASAGFTNQVLTNFSSSASHSGNNSTSVTAARMFGASGSPSFSALQPSSSETAFESGSFDKTSAAVSVAHVMVNKVDKEANGSSPTTGKESISSGVQSSGFGSGSTTISQSVPFQFGSSSSSPINGTSAIAPFTFNATPFSSSSSVSNSFASTPSFGLSSTASSTESKSIVSATGGASATFSFSPTVPATSSGAFGSSSGSLTTSSVTGMVDDSNSSVTSVTFNFGANPSGNNFASSSVGSLSSNFGSSLSSSAGTANSSGGFSWQTPQSSSVPTFNSSSSSGFTFGSSASVFSFAATNSSVPSFASPPPMFGNPASTTFQTNTDDSMAEDTTQSSSSTVPMFGQPIAPSPSGFTFNSTVQPSTPFQFGGQPSQSSLQNSQFPFGGQPSQSGSQNPPFPFSGQTSQIASQNPPFQGSGSLELNAGGGSFVFGSGGENSGRRTVKINRNKHSRKK